MKKSLPVSFLVFFLAYSVQGQELGSKIRVGVVADSRSFAIITLQGRLVNRKNNDVLPSDEKRLQSNAFRLVVKESGYKSPTFDEILADQ